LLAAADHYAHLAGLCTKGLRCPWELTLPPDKYDDWTGALRQDQIERLSQARDHDRAAIAAISAALAAAGSSPASLR
jgi:hypothetical protein